MVKWEYIVIFDTVLNDLEKFLNHWGADGWELVSWKRGDGRFIFKRSKVVLDDKKWVYTKPTTVTWYYDNDKDVTEIE
jgi:hypothetical protein